MKKAMLALVVAGLSLVVLGGEAKADKYSQFKGSWGGSYKQNCYSGKQFGGQFQGGYQGGCTGKQGCYQGGCIGKQGYDCPTDCGYGGCMPKQKYGCNKQWGGGYSQKQY